MMLEPTEMDWPNEDDSTVYYAAADGIPQAKAELQRREADRRRMPNASTRGE